MRCRAAPPRASPGRSAPSARREGKAAAPLHAPRDRGGASGARVDFAGTGWGGVHGKIHARSEEHTSELQSRLHLVCRLLLEKKKKTTVIPDDDVSHHCGHESQLRASLDC